MARKTKEDAQKTREGILEAASLVFVKKGVAQASLNEIAAEAGVTRGAVYWHFTSKVDIFTALHDQLHEPFTHAILQDLEKDHPHPLRQLEEICGNLLADLGRDARKKRLLTIFYLKCDYSGEFEPVLESQSKQRAENFKLLSRYFERAQSKGHLPKDADPKILTLSLFCYLTGIVQEYIRYDRCIKLKEQASVIMRQFFAGVN